MAKATIQVNIEDSTDDVTIASGTAAQTKACMIVYDDTLVNMERTIDLTNMLETAIAAVRRDTPIATS